MIFRLCLALTFCMLVSACSESNPEAEKAGATAAEQWLRIIDRGKYQNSWDQAATIFQAKVSKSEWGEKLAGERTPLGFVKTRTLERASFSTSIPGAIGGDYVVSVFDASFKDKARATETVTVAKVRDDWKVINYYVK